MFSFLLVVAAIGVFDFFFVKSIALTAISFANEKNLLDAVIKLLTVCIGADTGAYMAYMAYKFGLSAQEKKEAKEKEENNRKKRKKEKKKKRKKENFTIINKVYNSILKRKFVISQLKDHYPEGKERIFTKPFDADICSGDDINTGDLLLFMNINNDSHRRLIHIMNVSNVKYQLLKSSLQHHQRIYFELHLANIKDVSKNYIQKNMHINAEDLLGFGIKEFLESAIFSV